MKRHAFTAATLLLSFGHLAADTITQCIAIAKDGTIAVPKDDMAPAATVEFREGNVVLASATKKNDKFTLDEKNLSIVHDLPLRTLEKRRAVQIALLTSANDLRGALRPFTVGTEVCADIASPVSSSSNNGKNDSTPPSGTHTAIGPPAGCTLQGKEGLEIIFGPDGSVCNWSRQYSVEGDLISISVVGVQETTPQENVTMTIEGCGRAPSLAPILISGTFPTKIDKAGGEAKQTPYTKQFVGQRCFGSAPVIVISNFPAAGTPLRFPLVQYERYRGTLQLGVSYSDRHDETFEVRTTGTEKRIFTKGPTGRGPEYLATVVVYGVPNYFRKSPYYGRDIIHDQSIGDRLGAVVSVGLSKPGDRFAAGLSFELVYGLNLLGLYEWSRIDALDGIKSGDVYTGDVTLLPTTRSWDGKVVVGLGLDLRYVTALFDRK